MTIDALDEKRENLIEKRPAGCVCNIDDGWIYADEMGDICSLYIPDSRNPWCKTCEHDKDCHDNH